jgi:hypothetical protein
MLPKFITQPPQRTNWTEFNQTSRLSSSEIVNWVRYRRREQFCITTQRAASLGSIDKPTFASVGLA